MVDLSSEQCRNRQTKMYYNNTTARIIIENEIEKIRKRKLQKNFFSFNLTKSMVLI